MVLLVVSSVQVAWWLVDQSLLSNKIERSQIADYEEDARAARRLLARGETVEGVQQLFPHLDVEGEGALATVTVAPDALADLARERRSHSRQYVWESIFFLLVLLSCIGVLWRGLREEARLRRRHENFLASVSHELRSPLSSLRLQTETLQRRNLSEERRSDVLARSVADLHRLEGLVDNVLEAAKIDDESGRRLLRWQPEEIDVSDVVRRQLHSLHPPPPGGVRDGLAQGTRAFVDRRALEIMLRNLLVNACRATADGGEIEVSGEVTDGQLRLSVRDTGCGFEAEEAGRLFDKFYRPGNTLDSGARGSGLGLYIVRQLAELGGGTATGRSGGRGLGAVFEITLPQPLGAP